MEAGENYTEYKSKNTSNLSDLKNTNGCDSMKKHYATTTRSRDIKKS